MARVQAPRPIKIYPDTASLSLARSYVESDPSRYSRHIRSASRATNVPAALIRAAIVTRRGICSVRWRT